MRTAGASGRAVVQRGGRDRRPASAPQPRSSSAHAGTLGQVVLDLEVPDQVQLAVGVRVQQVWTSRQSTSVLPARARGQSPLELLAGARQPRHDRARPAPRPRPRSPGSSAPPARGARSPRGTPAAVPPARRAEQSLVGLPDGQVLGVRATRRPGRGRPRRTAVAGRAAPLREPVVGRPADHREQPRPPVPAPEAGEELGGAAERLLHHVLGGVVVAGSASGPGCTRRRGGAACACSNRRRSSASNRVSSAAGSARRASRTAHSYSYRPASGLFPAMRDSSLRRAGIFRPAHRRSRLRVERTRAAARRSARPSPPPNREDRSMTMPTGTHARRRRDRPPRACSAAWPGSAPGWSGP